MIRGERFELDLGSDDEAVDEKKPVLPAAFIGDILERKPTAATPPTAPAPPSLKSKSGFPEHKKRPLESRFKLRKSATVSSEETSKSKDVANASPDVISKPEPGTTPSQPKSQSWEESERSQIDRENQQRLDDMTPAQLEEERRELMESLSPAFLQRLLQRPSRQNGEEMQKILRQADINDGSNESDLYGGVPQTEPTEEQAAPPKKTKPPKSVSFAEPTEASNSQATESDTLQKEKSATSNPDSSTPQEDSIHFPRAPQPPSLDPSSDTFLEDLHSKYFPELPADPEKLSWMQSSSTPNNYSPKSKAFAAQDLRFGFNGALLPPSLSAEIPVTAGLHHHGDSPDAAGYTIPELAHLAHSSYAAQRCIAFQTLGRLLYRLGRGEFGDAGEPNAEDIGADPRDMKGELARGLWSIVERERVVENLVRESEGQGIDGGRHVSAKAYATEAVWLWQKGGGRRWKAT